MKQVLGVSARRLLLASSAVFGLTVTAAQANLIIDPGFEAPSANPTDILLPTSQAGAAVNATYPWYDLLTAGGDQAEISSDIPTFAGGPTPPAADRINSGTGGNATTTPPGNLAHTGDQYDYAFTVGQSSGSVGGVAQLITGINSGDAYVGSAYFFMKQNTSTDGDRFQASGSNDTVKMIFEDSTGAAIGSTIVSTVGGDSGKVDNTSAPNTWIQLSTAAAKAPAGATQVLFEMALTRGASGGVQFGDDADLEDTTLPEPASLVLIAAMGLLPIRARRR